MAAVTLFQAPAVHMYCLIARLQLGNEVHAFIVLTHVHVCLRVCVQVKKLTQLMFQFDAWPLILILPSLVPKMTSIKCSENSEIV